ncbi:hypothetical protein [Lysobacter sp. Hz 25]|uniref:virion core protein, T7 gp14 family n=1 Tax=Lysobacter sp. Hz 25 TaxID=3383698 RepID=UPI0038D38B42
MIAGAVYANSEQKKATKDALQVQQAEIDASAATQKNERMEEARALRATARAAAAEAAIGGNSVDAISIDVMGQAGRDVALIETNRRNGSLASSAEANARIRGANAEMVQGIGGAATTGMSGYQNYMIRRKGATGG